MKAIGGLSKSSLHPHSLSMRVMLSAFLVLFLFNIVIIAILDHNNKDKVLDKYSEQLRLQLYHLLAISEFEKNELQISAFLSDDRLNQKSGDLIAIIYNNVGNVIWDSFSAKRIRFEQLPTHELGKTFSSITRSLSKEPFLIQSLSVLWDSEQDAQTLTFVVGLKTSVYQNEIIDFRKKLFLGSLIVISSILGLQGIILFFAFQNLNTIANDLKAISLGAKDKLDGHYPKELQTVSLAINQLISSERTQKERYQKSLADLAHSLKTPLSVLQVHSEKVENKSLFSEQIERMNQIISYQLQRASHMGSSLGSNPIEIKPVIKEINKALEKVYHHKQVSFVLTAEKDSRFYGDKNDLMELLGNLLDNAYKHCHTKILVDIQERQDKNTYQLDVRIEDDGQGISESDREYVLQRGARADSLNPGQGIGLAVVVDIVNSYQGTVQISNSTLGGASFHLQFKQTLFS